MLAHERRRGAKRLASRAGRDSINYGFSSALESVSISASLFFPVEVSVSVSITLSVRLRHQAGTSQALCTPGMKVADSLKLFALSGHSTHDNWRTSPGLWARIMKLPTVSGSEHFLRTPCTKLGGRLRLSAPPCWKLPTASGSEQSSHDKRGTSQALCTRMMKLPTVPGSDNCLGTPFTEIEERFGLCAPPG